ncbi:hypothetical protein HPP92_016327 [Vanilla planifolia]|uniref:Uncharacterized protein n=1 Tax=Vanilla planifolia TaxID=51239 RepID=A0A835QIY8_VANPL|nr:hypothetical protein HPP92_016327 [Vanilla planifolia]
MASSNMCPLSLPNRSTSRLLHSRAELSISTSYFHAPRRHLRRKNHLRPKLPNPLPSPIQPEAVEHSYDADNLVLVGEVEANDDPIAAFGIANPFPQSAVDEWFPGSVLGIAARFAAFVAVQTAIIVWYLFMEDARELEVERRKKNQLGLVRKEKEMAVGKGNRMEAEEFGRMISEIRAMAREARDRESKGRQIGGGVVKVVGEGLEIKKKIIAGIAMDGIGDELAPKRVTTKLKMFRDAWYLPKAKGFGGSKRAIDESRLDKGGVQQVARSETGIESTKHHEDRNLIAQPSVVNIQSSIKDCKRMPEQLHDLTNMQISSVTKMEQSKVSSEDSIMNNLIQDAAEVTQSGISCSENTNFESLAEMKRSSSKESSEGITRALGVLQNKESKSMPITRNREVMTNSQESQWWIKLPCVFGIILKRVPNRSGDAGLYCLEMNSAELDGNLPSCAIVFEDGNDAKKFSLLLESFFDDLGDVRAKVVPLTVPEIEAICSGDKKFTVVRKGQLCLYAGQPLLEVEKTLRSLME